MHVHFLKLEFLTNILGVLYILLYIAKIVLANSNLEMFAFL